MSLASDVPAGSPRLHLSKDVQQIVYRLLAAGLICLALGIATDAFFTTNNILNVLRQASLLFFLASGLTLVILTGGLDLSIGAISASRRASPPPSSRPRARRAGTLTGLAPRLAIGICNGLMVAKLRIPSFIATYGMLWVLHGITYYYMAGETIHGFPARLPADRLGAFPRIPIPVYLMVVFLVVRNDLRQRTVWGQQIYAIGANPVAARLTGIPIHRRLILVYGFSGAMAGVASIVFLARLNSAEGDIGEAMTLPAIAAVLIAVPRCSAASAACSAPSIGALILTLVLNGMNLLAINASWQPLVTGAILVFAVWLDMYGRKKA